MIKLIWNDKVDGLGDGMDMCLNYRPKNVQELDN